MISGYPASIIEKLYINKLTTFTASNINQKIAHAEERLHHHAIDQPLFISLGENCGPGVKLRQAGLAPMGAGFFDNLVVPMESIIRLLDEDFGHLLMLRNLSVGEWETHDSVHDTRYDIFFHHYFHPVDQSLQKIELIQGQRKRRIAEGDIPLFLSSVMAQFEYLAAKMRFMLRAPHKKFLVLRRLKGDPAPSYFTDRLSQALHRFGAQNARLLVIHSSPIKEGSADTSIHHMISEEGDRWGLPEKWKALAEDLVT